MERLWESWRDCGRHGETVEEMEKLLETWRDCGRAGEIVGYAYQI